MSRYNLNESLMDNMDDVGLIYIKTIDPVAKLIMTITQNTFTTFGFYYKNTISGKTKINLILYDLFTLDSPSWFKKKWSLKDIIKYPLVSYIAIQSICDIVNPINRSDIRKAVLHISNNKYKLNIQDSLRRTFGINIRHTEHTIISDIMNFLNVKGKKCHTLFKYTWKEKDIDFDPYESISDLHSKTNYIATFAKLFNIPSNVVCDQPHNGQFKIYELSHKHEDISITIRNILDDSIKMVKSIVNTFIELLFIDHKFYEKVRGSCNINQLRFFNEHHDIFGLLESMSDSGSKCLHLLQRWMDGQHISYSEFTKFEKDINKFRYLIAKHIGQNRPSYIRLTSKPKPKHHELYTSADILRDEIHKIAKRIEQKDTATLNINLFIEHINKIHKSLHTCHCHLHKIPGEYSQPGITLITDKPENAIPLTLHNGEKIILTTRNYDLSRFNKTELIEIMEALDILASDDSYDLLRADITRKISLL